jgi:hypothetical protein
MVVTKQLIGTMREKVCVLYALRDALTFLAASVSVR